MQVNRRFLFWGILLVALGGVLVAADLGAIDTPALTDALRLWPLAIVAIGLSLVLRKTRWSLAGLILAAALPAAGRSGSSTRRASRASGHRWRPSQPWP